MNAFDESKHSRDHSGQFTTKSADEAPGGTVALTPRPVVPPARKSKGKKAGKNPHAVANPELAKAMRELRFSSAAEPHTPKPRKGTRSDRNRRAIKDSAE